jgi:hypothetical protein
MKKVSNNWRVLGYSVGQINTKPIYVTSRESTNRRGINSKYVKDCDRFGFDKFMLSDRLFRFEITKTMAINDKLKHFRKVTDNILKPVIAEALFPFLKTRKTAACFRRIESFLLR